MTKKKAYGPQQAYRMCVKSLPCSEASLNLKKSPSFSQRKFESLRVLWLSEAIQQTQNTEAICIPEVFGLFMKVKPNHTISSDP